ncbi:MAG: endo alpha-1,4 polygalactosaminidase [Chloroflexi bacterium]|nr:endo alpha-1,4 polygalactosaminidase [Chloroflexota bacterium]
MWHRMWFWRVWLLVLPVIAQVSEPRAVIQSIQNYIVYYGEGRAEELRAYDLAIVQPETLTEMEITDLHNAGILLVAYLSVGEAEPDREWFERVDVDWLLGENTNWGSYFVDTREVGWQDLMVEIGGGILARGYDGLLLDTVDTADLFPETAPGMIALIQQLRQAYPDALLIANRGFGIVSEIPGVVDAVMFEDLSTTYNFETNQYEALEPKVEVVEQLIKLRDQTGLVILALDYAAPGDQAAAQRAVEIARSYGFIPAVSVISLEDLPDYKLVECVATPSDMEGPYYIANAPFKESLYPEGTPGQRLTISGTVYTAGCAGVLAGAEVDVWQADSTGVYDFSDQFLGRGRVLTDANGRYTFETVLPGLYQPRPRHIHFRVYHPDAGVLITQLYFEGSVSGAPDEQTIALEQDGDTLRGTFNIVLGP